MRPKTLELCCFAEYADNQWSAMCLDFCLAAQADTAEEAIAKLDSQIKDYLKDVLEGEDSVYGRDLLNRRAPLKYWLKYYYIALLCKLQSKLQSEPKCAGRDKPLRLLDKMLPMRLA